MNRVANHRLPARLIGGLLLCITSAAAAAQDWKPEKPVEIVATNAPGGGSDRIGRIMIRILQDRQLVPVPVSVLNRPGGGGSVAYNYVNQRPGDGHSSCSGRAPFSPTTSPAMGPVTPTSRRWCASSTSTSLSR